MPGSRLPRRRLLGLGTAGLIATATACTPVSPTIVGGPSTPPSTTPAREVPGIAAGVEQEAALLGAVTGTDALATRRREAHAAHLLALALPDPALRLPDPARATPTPAPPVTGGDYRRLATAAGSSHRKAAIAASGSAAQFWAALAAFARSSTAARTIAGSDPRPQPEPVSGADAMAQLLTQVHAAIFGYQAALAPLRPSAQQDARARAARRLAALIDLRDDLSERLVAAKAEPPVAEPGYDLGALTTPAESTALQTRLEDGLQPWLGRWVRAVDDDGRTAAVDALLDTVAAAVALGATVSVWPGYLDS